MIELNKIKINFLSPFVYAKSVGPTCFKNDTNEYFWLWPEVRMDVYCIWSHRLVYIPYIQVFLEASNNLSLTRSVCWIFCGGIFSHGFYIIF
jgi:hypothetical protein